MACALLHNGAVTPAPSASEPSSPGIFRELLRRRALGRMLVLRLRGVPIIATIALTLTLLEPTPLRVSLFGSAVVALVLVGWYESRLSSPSDARLSLNVVITGILQLMVTFAAGGIAGPVFPGVLLVALVASVLLSPREAGSFVLGVQLPVVWIFAGLQYYGLLPGLWVPAYRGLFAQPGTEGTGPFVAATFASFLLVAAFVIGRYLRKVVGELAAETAEERQAALDQNLEAARTMSALSGEIAHELKNPLASIKGLTALVGRELTGVPAERMDVLRREVDRMQAILDEFLTYSRPLVPLTVERVELRDLAADVVALHEGMAAERDVSVVTLPGPPFWVRCDPRKIRQVVINLVQNALDASPAGSRIEIDVRACDGRAREGDVALVVTDGGSGIDPDVLPRLFSVGMTTKERGTGLGLVVARGLARQHGGELTLENGERGGARATLVLKPSPPEDELLSPQVSA